jgi:hypothetical protein
MRKDAIARMGSGRPLNTQISTEHKNKLKIGFAAQQVCPEKENEALAVSGG